MLGHPLLVGEEYWATTQDDVLVRWKPGAKGEYITIAHPQPGTPEPDLTPVTMFGGYPMALSSGGIVLADDQVSPFIASITGITKPVWHRDIANRLGVPTAYNNLVFTNVGGPGGRAAIVALHAGTGKTVWEFAPNGFPQEPFEFIQRAKERPPTLAEKQAIEQARIAMKNNGVSGTIEMPSRAIGQATPVINAPHGHWENAGLVVTAQNVYGQVANSIVSIDQATGAMAWHVPLARGENARSIAATKDHLLVSLERRLIAIDLATGTIAMDRPTPRGGTLSIANGMIFLAMGSTDGGQILALKSIEKSESPEGGQR